MNRNAKSLQKKAKKIAKVNVEQIGEFTYNVLSTSGKTYELREHGGSYLCSCKWSEYHNTSVEPCSHVLAVIEHRKRIDGMTTSAWANEEDAHRQHRPVEQVGMGLWTTTRRMWK